MIILSYHYLAVPVTNKLFMNIIFFFNQYLLLFLLLYDFSTDKKTLQNTNGEKEGNMIPNNFITSINCNLYHRYSAERAWWRKCEKNIMMIRIWKNKWNKNQYWKYNNEMKLFSLFESYNKEMNKFSDRVVKLLQKQTRFNAPPADIFYWVIRQIVWYPVS